MQRAFLFLSGLLIVLLLNGCNWLNPQVQQTAPKKQVIQFVQNINIVDKERLEKGGKLLVVAFRAGPDVEATEELDHVALQIVKSVSEGLNETFEILTAENASDADLIMDGYITLMNRPSMMRGIMLKRNKVALGIRGSIVDRKTGSQVTVFSDAREAETKEQTHLQIGETIGNDLGQYIFNEMRK